MLIIRRVSVSLFVLVSSVVFGTTSVADPAPAGAFVSSKVAFAVQVGGNGRTHTIVAYRIPGTSSTRVVAVRNSDPLGISEYDDEILGEEALKLLFVGDTQVVRGVEVNASLPDIGLVTLTAYGPISPGGMGAYFYQFSSRFEGLAFDSWVTGSVGGAPITGEFYLGWGADVSGYFHNLPLGFRHPYSS